MKKTKVTTSTKTVSKKVELKQLTNDEFGTVKVVTTSDGDGYACLDDLCDILKTWHYSQQSSTCWAEHIQC